MKYNYPFGKVFIIAEIGINHNGDIKLAKKLIAKAKDSGCDAVKFQKRTVEKIYSKEELDKFRESPWGTTNREQKNGLEFGDKQYREIDEYCRKIGIEWFASAWDEESQLFLRRYETKFNKVASAMLTDRSFLEMVASEKKYTFISTGASTLQQIDKAINIFKYYECPYEIMYCNSTYPMPVEDANLLSINSFMSFFAPPIGYSSHEVGIVCSCASIALGATSLERHITLDRSLYGSDQSSSLEIAGLKKLVSYVRAIETALGDGERRISDKEKEVMKKLRKIDTL